MHFSVLRELERHRERDRRSSKRISGSGSRSEDAYTVLGMDSGAVPEVGGSWAARGVAAAATGGAAGAAGSGVVGGSVDGLPSWNGTTPAQDSAARRSNPKVSRWSDAPPEDGNPVSESRPPAGLEPPSKKVRNDSQPVVSADYRDASGAAYGAAAGYGEGPPGLVYGQSGTVTTGVETTQNYGVAGGQGYGTAYGVQQSYSSQSYASQYTPAQNAPASFAPGSAKGTGALFYKTKLCTKFKIGSCTFNERCHFAHGMEELRKPPPGWEDMAAATGGKPAVSFMGGQQRKTRLCRYFLEGNCPYGDRCNFLHGNEEAQKTSGMEPSSGSYTHGSMAARPGYKTRLCAKWEKGELCDFGDKCHFAHGPAELQAYVGVSSYPTGGTMTQYPQPEAMAPNMHADPTMMNPASLAAPYGAPINYASTGSVNPVVAPTASYTYWDASAAQGQPTASTQGYVQANQTMHMQANQAMPWMPTYSTDGGYSTHDNDTVVPPQYPQQSQQQQINQFAGGGTAHDYQASTQNVAAPYVQDERQSNYQGEAVNGDGGYYHGAYNETSYPNQQADYSARFNMAQAWGGNM